MAIDIDIAALVITRQRCSDIDGFNAKDLRIGDNADRQGNARADERTLGIRSQQTAARLVKTVAAVLLFFIQRNHTHLTAQLPCQR